MQIFKKNEGIFNVLTLQDAHNMLLRGEEKQNNVEFNHISTKNYVVFMYIFVCMCTCTCKENRLERYLPISLWGVGVGEWSKGRNLSFFLYISGFFFFTIQKTFIFVFEIKGKYNLTYVYLFISDFNINCVVLKCVCKFFDMSHSKGGN